jgi:hypothetical protein
MRRVMDGETVYVSVRSLDSETETDRLGNPVYEWAEPVAVDHVLASVIDAEERDYSRPDGYVATYTLAFPRGCTLDLRGAKVTVGGRELTVIGDPVHVNSPLAWDMRVTAGVHDG